MTLKELNKALQEVHSFLQFDGTEIKFGNTPLITFDYEEEGDPFCCGVNHLGNFDIYNNNDYFKPLTKANFLKLEKLYPLVIQYILEIEYKKRVKNNKEITLCFTDNSSFPSNLWGKAAVASELFTLVKTFTNSNSGNTVNLYVSN